MLALTQGVRNQNCSFLCVFFTHAWIHKQHDAIELFPSSTVKLYSSKSYFHPVDGVFELSG
jgi:hypothetical protein